jgi:hypothetical protein
VSLTVNGDYTPYIYGELTSSSTNKITVQNGNDAFTRSINSAYLRSGSSGILTIPTSSNYVSFGWTKDATDEAMALKDMLEKPMTNVNVDLKTATYQTIRDEVAKSYQITEYDTDGDEPWFTLYATNNTACSNMTYQGLPFYSLAIFKSTEGVSASYWYKIEKSKVSYDYTSYINKIVQDFANMNISMSSTTIASNLAAYIGYDADNNYYNTTVSDDDDYYRFTVYANYRSASVKMVLKDMLEKPFGTVDLDFRTATYSKIKTVLSALYDFEESTETSGDKDNYFYIYSSKNPSLEKYSYLGRPLSSMCIRNRAKNGCFYVEYNFNIEKSAMPNPYTYLDEITKDFNNTNIPMSYELDPYPSTPQALAVGYLNIGGYAIGGISYWIYLYSWDYYHFEIGVSYYVK